ncbi:hypothetical protein [Pontiella sulfatireligans]|uniref:Uncharacterized protein n=1 Tax=Pontiella sulfatireligans TaxID=2750658 RepID=A0A6C2US76_9BACT|nr:hypothetical protein [Pontiella sulfatireligans]VGO23190.1 hypothetical protein SCARR_05295 [Pontiella sulfatireligans]
MTQPKKPQTTKPAAKAMARKNAEAAEAQASSAVQKVLRSYRGDTMAEE